MAKVKVYEFTKYNVNTDEEGPRGFMGTLKYIKGIGGTPVLETAKEVDASELDYDGRYKEDEEEDEEPD